MIRRPVWLLGFVIMAAGYGARALALHSGALNVVQPLMVSELVMLVLLLWLWYSTTLRARDLLAAFATAAGSGRSSSWRHRAPASPHRATPLVRRRGRRSSGAALVFTLLGIAGPRLAARAAARGRRVGGFALVAAITKSMTDVLVKGLGALFVRGSCTRSA